MARHVVRARVEVIADVSCPMSVVLGQHGMVDAADLALLVAAGGPTMTTATIPSAAHHLMLEAPQALAAVIEGFVDGVDGRHYEIVDDICCTAYREPEAPAGRSEEMR